MNVKNKVLQYGQPAPPRTGSLRSKLWDINFVSSRVPYSRPVFSKTVAAITWKIADSERLHQGLSFNASFSQIQLLISSKFRFETKVSNVPHKATVPSKGVKR